MAYSLIQPSTTRIFESTRCVGARNGWTLHTHAPPASARTKSKTSQPRPDKPQRSRRTSRPRNFFELSRLVICGASAQNGFDNLGDGSRLGFPRPFLVEFPPRVFGQRFAERGLV